MRALLLALVSSLVLFSAACGGGTGDTKPDTQAQPQVKEDPKPAPDAPAADPAAKTDDPAAKAGDQATSKQLAEFLASLGPADKSKTNPLKEPSADQLAAAKKTYSEVCSSCHGLGGKGDGPAAMALKPPPAVFTSTERMSKTTEGEKYAILKKGIPGTGMVGLAGGWTDEQTWAMISYLESFAAKSADGE